MKGRTKINCCQILNYDSVLCIWNFIKKATGTDPGGKKNNKKKSYNIKGHLCWWKIFHYILTLQKAGW